MLNVKILFKTEHNAKYIYLFFTFALTLNLFKRLGAEGEKGKRFPHCRGASYLQRS